MLFNTPLFFWFFLIFFLLFNFVFVERRKHLWLLVVSSLIFYGSWNYAFLPLLVGNAVMDYLIAAQIQKNRERPQVKKRWLVLGANGYIFSHAGDGPKLAAFREVVAKYHDTPDRLSSTAEKDAHRKALNRLQSKFFKVPFDPDKNRDEAKEILAIYEQEIEGRYRGGAAMDLEAYLSKEIVEPLID